jgi:hypothetical protein
MRNKRASYRDGVEWIAFNDEPGSRDAEEVAGYVSTCLLADLFGKDRATVAKDIVRAREKDAAIGGEGA